MAKSMNQKNQSTELNVSCVALREFFEIQSIQASDTKIERFLFSLGCFPTQKIKVIAHLGQNYIIEVNSSRYSVDEALAQAIKLTQLP